MKLMRFCAGLLLLPACAAITRAVARLLLAAAGDSQSLIPPAAAAFCAGALVCPVAFFFMPAPTRSYILAHEMTHALWAAIMGAKVSDLRIRKTRGSVRVSEINFLIALAPYFFPLYTVLLVALYFVLALFVDFAHYTLLWMALAGLTWGFHVIFTLDALSRGQPDVERYGRMFSYTVIFFLNLLGVALWLVMFGPPTLAGLVNELRQNCAWAYAPLGRAVQTLLRRR